MSSIAWKDVNWSKVDSRVFRYQIRIFKASREKNIPKVKCLQKRLLRSLDAKLISVKLATTLKKDHSLLEIEKQPFITDLQKGNLVKRLRLNGKALLIPQVRINKTDRLKKRLFDIRKIEDKAKQVLCKLALEPEWEARFEANSYGYRPGRYAQDAMEAISLFLQNNLRENGCNKYVLNTKISNCFDQINHYYVLNKLETLPEIKNQVKAWLKVGILEEFLDERKKKNILENSTSISQVTILAPFLFNISLYGLEKYIKERVCTKSFLSKTTTYNKDVKQKSLVFVRYVNALVVIHEDENVIHETKEEITKWLSDNINLKLSDKKTFIRSTNNTFNFLGFTFITININDISKIKIYPSRQSQTLLLLKVRNIIQNNRSASAYNLIKMLQPVIIGWANYYKYSECSQVFKKLTHLILQMLRSWVFRRDTRNGRKIIKQRYFPNNKFYIFEGTKHFDNWILNGKQLSRDGISKNNWLPNMVWVKSEKWVKIKGTKSPFDGDNLYWDKRRQTKDA